MSAGARTPEDLETLFEDSVVIRDRETLASLFEVGGVLIRGDARRARGRDEIVHLALATWQGDRIYVADPRRVAQTRGIALIVAEHAISVVRRGRDGAWRYAIFLLTNDDGNERMER